MQKENLSTSIPKLIMAVILIVGIGAVLGVLSYFLSMPKDGVVVEEGVEKEEIKEEKITKDETADWQTYRNEEYGFEVRYPEDWKYIEREYETIVFGKQVPTQDYPFIILRRNSEKEVTGKMF